MRGARGEVRTEAAARDALSDGSIRLAIDKGLPTPAYLQLTSQLGRAIRERRLPPGSALPSERHLAEELDLSRMTVRRALEELAGTGLVERRHGSGTYVRGRPVEQTFDRVLGFSDEAEALGFRPGTTLLEMRTREADQDAAAALQIAEGDEILVVTRLRTADDAPLAIQVAHLPPAFRDLSRAGLRRNESLYRTLDAEFGVAPHHAHQVVAARLPTDWERRRLELPDHVPVLAMERTTFDEREVPFEYVRSVYRGDRYRMAQDLRPPERRPAGDTSGAPTGGASDGPEERAHDIPTAPPSEGTP